ncbi:hypothetical protein [Pelomonas sp. BJYL3]|uniref:hypothetical protein n=1 Tax=Pelomonas sp. BJYL3 TaxID=2976697 RepID=UPI0022B30990|nr:hypothetical protein [Pelomonas sp. BJYL3]
MDAAIQAAQVFEMDGFPVVTFRNDAIRPGYAARWAREMEALVARAQAFVLLFLPERPEETLEDRKQRALWLKSNKDALSEHCRALITVEPDPQERAAAAKEAQAMQKAFGLLLVSVASESEARDLAQSLLAA